ncbi:MAG: RcnB family protein, partial [Sphingomicrobium sp.]
RVQSGNYRQWSRGQRFDRRYANNYQVIGNYGYYRLNAPPRGYHYVRSGDDIILVAIASGIIGAVFASIF